MIRVIFLEEIHEGVILVLHLVVAEVGGGEHEVSLAAGDDETLVGLLGLEELVKRVGLGVAELLLVAVLLALDVKRRLHLVLLGVGDGEEGLLLPLGVEADAHLRSVLSAVGALHGHPAAGLLDVVELEGVVMSFVTVIVRGEGRRKKGGGEGAMERNGLDGRNQRRSDWEKGGAKLNWHTSDVL